MTDIISLIKEKSGDLSKNHVRLADYIAANHSKAAYMTAAKLGAAVGVSESTVVRFAGEIGFDGYPEFQESLQSYVKSNLTSCQRIELTNTLITRDTLKSVLTQDIHRIRATIDEADEGDFETAVDFILNAKKIYIFGAMSSAILAKFLGGYLGLVFDNVVLVEPQGEGGVRQQMFHISAEDMLFVASFPRYSRTAVSAARFAKERGAKVVALTDSETSPIAALANGLLTAKSDMVGYADSLVAPLSVVNALIVAVGMRRRHEIETALAKLESLWGETDVYEKS
ncbi:MAG: MurR/RpiR family transcriptional regulator [Oscillospiraceae bacterium]|nr:MurR/RpiR family transcriptional regulator [Oscillospiraceae bacterium]